MISLQRKLYQVGKILSDALPGIVSHYFRDNSKLPYCIWAEDGENLSFNADNLKAEQAIHGTVDYFTQVEYDANIDTIQDTLQHITNNWDLTYVEFEDTQRVIHYEWSFTVIADGGGTNGQGENDRP